MHRSPSARSRCGACCRAPRSPREDPTMNLPLETFLRTPDATAPFADHRAMLARRFDLAAEAQRQRDGERVGIGRPHESAHLHVSGEATYVDDLPELAGTLHVALGLSPVAHGRITAIDLGKLRALPGVVA